MFEVQFTDSPDLEKELADLQAEQNEILARQRELIQEIQTKRNAINLEAADKREKALLAAKEAELEKQKQAEIDKEKEITATVAAINKADLKSWNAAHPYQKEDIIETYFAYRNGEHGFFNANDMGLGKTFEAGAAIELYMQDHPGANVLWLSKSSIVETGGTKRELEQWTDLTVVELLGRTVKKQREFIVGMIDNMDGIVLLTNYETLRTTQSLKDAKFDMIVMDECHKLKGGANPSGPTGLWKAVRDYIWDNEGTKDNPIWVNSVDYILMLSGTPMVNRVAELWAYLHIFDPMKFTTLRQFESAFDAYVEYGGKVQTEKILNMCLQGRMVRRTRTEVGLQLPEFTQIHQMVQYNPQQQDIYDQMKTQFFIWLDDQDESLTATAIIAQLTRLRQISVWPVFTQKRTDDFGNETIVGINVEDSAKVDEAMEIIEEANDQVVIFCNFNSVFDEIKKRCANMNLRCEFITGATKKDMGRFEIGFQQGDIDVLCINSSMGEGLNLQKNPDRWSGGAAVGIHLDMWWNPARDEQCNARIYRQGANMPVTIYKIHAPGSIDDFIKAMSDEKGELFEGIMGDSSLRPANVWKQELRKIL